jgi:hypothetical protein
MNSPKPDLAAKVMDAISRDQIKVLPVARFTRRERLLWLLVTVCLFLGAISIEFVFHVLMTLEWGLLPLMQKNQEKIALILIPAISLFLSTIALLASLRIFRTTKYGYRPEPLKLVLALVVSAVVVGWLGFILGLPPKLDVFLNKYLPVYQSWETTKVLVWNNPNEWLLAGRVASLDEVQ